MIVESLYRWCYHFVCTRNSVPPYKEDKRLLRQEEKPMQQLNRERPYYMGIAIVVSAALGVGILLTQLLG
jgi:hypothetical protein